MRAFGQYSSGGFEPAPSIGGPAPPGYGPQGRLDVGGAADAFAGAGGCDYLPEGFWRDFCKGVATYVGGGNGAGGRSQQQAGGGTSIPCAEGRIKVGNKCVAPGDAFPGGDPFITEAGMQAVQGSFGMPAITPTIETRTHRTCPSGMVLGKDDLCYPRAILNRRSRFRKWRQPTRPPVSAADAKALRKVDQIRSKLRDLGKQADLKVTKR